jgi:thiol:disulfide interchange protein DsbC
MKLKQIFASFCALSCVGLYLAGAAVAQDDDNAEKQLRESLAQLAPDLPITEISESPLPGVYEVVSEGQIYYLTPDGRFMVEGSIIDLQQRVNLSEQRRGALQLELIREVPEEQMVVFDNEAGDATRWITVFTDTDCGYCQKLHREIDEITNADIKVRYLMFPRAGMESASFRELQSVWCAADQQAAMTAAKTGGRVEEAACDNPIQSHVDLAGRVGLRGTPLIYLDNGTKIPGYRPAAELIKMVNDSEPMAMK